jgi:H+/Cl- antiporter ClcA
VKPYLDHVHMFLDIITAIFNVLVVLLMFSFLEGVADGTTTIIITVFVTMFLLITMVICVVTYINSWLKMKNIHSLRQWIDRCRGRDQNDPENSPGLNTDLELTTKHD